MLIDYLISERPNEVDIDLTIKSSALMIIVKIPSGGLAQVDTVVTHPKYSEWMKGRYTPEKGIKGYITGNLYKVLGDYLVLTIGTEGVLARLKDGQRVSSKFRKGITYQSVSTNFRNFFKDIADYVVVGQYQEDALLKKHPGLDPENVNLEDFAYGILGLSRTLEAANITSSKEMLNEIYQSFVFSIEQNVEKKLKKNISQSQEEKMKRLNKMQSERIKKIFGA